MARAEPQPRTSSEARAHLRAALDALQEAESAARVKCGPAMREALREAQREYTRAQRAIRKPCAQAKRKVDAVKKKTRTLRAKTRTLRTDAEQRKVDQTAARKQRWKERDEERWENAAGGDMTYDSDDDAALLAFVLRKPAYRPALREMIAEAKRRGGKLSPEEALRHYLHDNRSNVEAAFARRRGSNADREQQAFEAAQLAYELKRRKNGPVEEDYPADWDDVALEMPKTPAFFVRGLRAHFYVQKKSGG